MAGRKAGTLDSLRFILAELSAAADEANAMTIVAVNKRPCDIRIRLNFLQQIAFLHSAADGGAVPCDWASVCAMFQLFTMVAQRARQLLSGTSGLCPPQMMCCESQREIWGPQRERSPCSQEKAVNKFPSRMATQ
jgi:hypothetical protein